MPKLPTIGASDLIKILKILGFEQVRQKGSHRFFRHEDGRTVVVPDHKGEDLGRGIMSKILKDIEVSRDDFIKWHSKVGLTKSHFSGTQFTKRRR